MSMTVRKRRDDKTPHVFIHKIADVRGGVSVKACVKASQPQSCQNISTF